jgi:HAD superfamily hydrolase (TIGR01509 family)
LPHADGRVTEHDLRLVIFDCDGVLIDSEPLSHGVVMAEAAALGWDITEAEAQALVGLSWTALRPLFESGSGKSLPADWAKTMQGRVVAVMRKGVETVPGARAMLEATAALGLPYRVASNSSHEEMDEKFAVTGLLPLVKGRVHSARDVARSKPAPDVFLAAAAAEGVAPANCLVVEDSVPGIAAAHEAGMRVVAYAPEGLSGVHAIPPHATIRSLAELPPILASAMLASAA